MRKDSPLIGCDVKFYCGLPFASALMKTDGTKMVVAVDCVLTINDGNFIESLCSMYHNLTNAQLIFRLGVLGSITAD